MEEESLEALPQPFVLHSLPRAATGYMCSSETTLHASDLVLWDIYRYGIPPSVINFCNAVQAPSPPGSLEHTRHLSTRHRRRQPDKLPQTGRSTGTM